jgi:hypothetical protein
MMNLFNNSCGGRANNMMEGGTVNDFETLQNARRDLIGEIDAIIQYDSHLHSTTDKLAKDTWSNIKGDELTHVGELLGLLNYLDPTQAQYVQMGIDEFDERTGRKN